VLRCSSTSTRREVWDGLGGEKSFGERVSGEDPTAGGCYSIMGIKQKKNLRTGRAKGSVMVGGPVVDRQPR